MHIASMAGPYITDPSLAWVFNTMGLRSSVSPACLAAYGGDEHFCFYPQYSLRFIKTPLFVSVYAWCVCVCV